jgi:hypothetical protein
MFEVVYKVDSSCKKTTLHLQQHFYGISYLKLLQKLYLYGKYSTQTMIFWFLWFGSKI